MAKLKNKRRPDQERQQPFDTTLKTWIKEQAREILPVLLPGAMLLEPIDVERIKPTMRVDRVFRVLYQGQEYILHIEFETGTDRNMRARLAVYNTLLYYEYDSPVISIIVYPFTTTIAESPLRVMKGEEELLTFHFLTLALFELDAQEYVREHVLCMYPLLPTMQGVDHRLMKQAVDELVAHYQDDQASLADRFVWIELVLDRTDTVALHEKEAIHKELKMYDQLWKESPTAQRKLAESKVEGAQMMLISFIKVRFPALAELAQEHVTRIKSPDALDLLAQQIYAAPDEATIRFLLTPSAA